MKIAIFVTYLILVTIFLGGAWRWAKKKGRQAKSLRNPSHMHNFFFSDLKEDFYVHWSFCVGFALATYIAGVIYSAVVRA